MPQKFSFPTQQIEGRITNSYCVYRTITCYKCFNVLMKHSPITVTSATPPIDYICIRQIYESTIFRWLIMQTDSLINIYRS